MDVDRNEVPQLEAYLLDCPLQDEAYEAQRIQYVNQIRLFSELMQDQAQVQTFKLKLNDLLTASIERDMVARTRAATNRSNRIMAKSPDRLKNCLNVAVKLTEVSPGFKEHGDKITSAFVEGDGDSAKISASLTELIDKALSEKRLPMRESFERQIEFVIRKLKVTRINAERSNDFRAAIVAMKESKRLSENYERLYKPMVSSLGFKRALKNLGNVDREVGGVTSADWMRLAQIKSSDDYRKMYTSVLAGMRDVKEKEKEVINVSSSSSDTDSSSDSGSSGKGGRSQKKLFKAFTAAMAKMKKGDGKNRKGKSHQAKAKGNKVNGKCGSK